MAEIKTRILLRNDQLSNWTANDSVTLLKGEVGIAMLDGNLAEVRVGDNTKWDASRKLRVEASQISGLTETISATALQYCLSSTDTNEWKLLSKKLDGTGDWEEAGVLNLDQLTGYALSTDVDALVAAVSADTLVSANAYTDAEIQELSSTVDELVSTTSAETLVSANNYTDDAIDALSINNYMLTADFNALSNEIGLSAASSTNPVVTKDDIAELAGAMHFVGAITPAEGESDADAIAREITDPAAGDIVVITTTSKEYLYSGSSWIELGDEVLYAKKTDVDALVNATSVALSTDYVEKINELSTATDALVAEVSAETLVSANAYTDEKIETTTADLSNAISSKVWFQDGLTAAGEHNDLSVVKVHDADLADYAAALASDSLDEHTIYVLDLSSHNVFGQKIENVADGTAATDAATYGQLTSTASNLSTATDALVAEVSAETLVSANAYTDEKIDALSIGDYALSADVDELVNATSVALSTDYVQKISDAKDEVVGESTDLSSANTVNGAKAYAKDYTDEQIAALSIDNYIEHGKVTSDELSGFFVLNCGDSTYREGEQAATES